MKKRRQIRQHTKRPQRMDPREILLHPGHSGACFCFHVELSFSSLENPPSICCPRSCLVAATFFKDDLHAYQPEILPLGNTLAQRSSGNCVQHLNSSKCSLFYFHGNALCIPSFTEFSDARITLTQ